jgi:Predicted nucleotide-binding protein containing TIR-like domain
MPLKPTIFFSSSSEAMNILDNLLLLISENDWALPQKWSQRTFQPGVSYLESFMRMTENCDFAVIVYSLDDRTDSRGQSYEAPRDNILFELGYFLAKLGPERVVVISPQSQRAKFPSNYAGYWTLTYDPSVGDPSQFLARVGVEVRDWFQRIHTSKSFVSPPPSPPDFSDTKVEDHIIPIYRDVTVSLDWYREFSEGILKASPSLNSRMLYYGPGLARHWPKSVPMRLVHSHGDLGQFLYSDFLNRRGDRGRIVEF